MNDTASAVTPSETRPSTTLIASASSSGRMTSPSRVTRSLTPRLRCRGTSGTGMRAWRSYMSYICSRPISKMSRKPAVVISAVFAPFRWMIELVVSVVLCTITDSPSNAAPAASSASAAPAISASCGASGLVSTLWTLTSPVARSSSEKSVKVPPMSMLSAWDGGSDT